MRALAQKRRGSIYVVVIGMSMLIGIIGLGALLASRVQVRAGASESDFAVARLCARAGLEIAMYRIQTDSAWRTDLGNGVWFANVPLGFGTYSVTAADPISGDITLPSNHPVVLTCTGAKGAAVYQIQVQVQVNPTALSSIGVSMCSGGRTSLNQCTLTTDQIVSSNGSFNVPGNSSVSGIVQEVGGFGGGGIYSSNPQPLNQALALPDPVHVFDYYKANGTSIPYTALYQSNNAQIVANTSFESNTNGWYVHSPSSANVLLSLDAKQHQDGQQSLLTSGRNGAGDVPATDLPPLSIRNGDTYAIQVPVYAKSTGNVRATLILQSSTGTQSLSTPNVTCQSAGAWVICQGNVTASWTGVLTKATLTLSFTDNTASLNIDAVSLRDISLPSNAYVMDRVLLSPNSNPYGAITNPQGIYVLDCNGQSVTIGPCRIVGTLVLLNAGSNTIVQGPITWEPAVANYPALLSDQSLTISFDASVGLSESTLGINLNPSGTPYPYAGGSADATATDAFPSIIDGIVYCGGNLSFSSAPSVKGCVVTAGSIYPNYSSLRLSYANAPYLTPPPGFASPVPALRPVPGSWQRVTH